MHSPGAAGALGRAPSWPLARARGGAELRDAAAFLADRPITHALVLGGSGFLGAPLVRRLYAAGVRTTCLLHRKPLPVAEAGVLRGSVDRFPWRTLEEDPPDVIFHLARISGRGGIRGALTRVRNRVANERLLLELASWARPPFWSMWAGRSPTARAARSRSPSRLLSPPPASRVTTTRPSCPGCA